MCAHARRGWSWQLGSVVGTLRSRDMDVRSTARNALAVMAGELGPLHLDNILVELKANLESGYMLHVRMSALHSVVVSVAKTYQPPSTLGGVYGGAQRSNGVVGDASRYPVMPFSEIDDDGEAGDAATRADAMVQGKQ